MEAIVLAIDKANQRVSLGIRQTEGAPWSLIDSRFKVGAFVSLDGDINSSSPLGNPRGIFRKRRDLLHLLFKTATETLPKTQDGKTQDSRQEFA